MPALGASPRDSGNFTDGLESLSLVPERLAPLPPVWSSACRETLNKGEFG